LLCSVPRKQRIKRGQSHIDAQHVLGSISSPCPVPPTSHRTLFTFSLLLPFSILPLALSLGPQGRPLSFHRHVPRLGRENSYVQPTARPSVGTGCGGGHTAESCRTRYARASNFHKMENGEGRLADWKEEGNNSEGGTETHLRVQWRRLTKRIKRIEGTPWIHDRKIASRLGDHVSVFNERTQHSSGNLKTISSRRTLLSTKSSLTCIRILLILYDC
jgi:hypothetical protein